ncbi:hypothetical protein D1007_55248 [Hordeum vulgare]|nr:hypothetical protein D1007_55248 [Hordeum vulgare]
MSGFMLRRFVELIASGVKTDKGFKEVHLNQVAKNCSDHFGFEFVVDGNEPDSSATAAAHGEAAVAHSTGKRKRASLMSEEEVLVMTNMSEAVREVANAIKSTTEAHPELYDAVMELPGFSEDDLLIILDYLNESANRARSHSFVQMTETRRTRWVIHHLSKLKDDVPKGGV